MAIIVLQHSESVTIGRLGPCLRDHGKPVDIRRLDLPVGAWVNGAHNQHIPADFDDVDGVIALGGEMMVGDPLPWMNAELEFLKETHARKLPLLGICLGAQMIAKALGGEVAPLANDGAEWGMAPVKQHPIANTDIILAGVPWTSWQFHAHGQEIKALPAGAACLQFSDKTKVQSFRAGLRTYGFQYHFECDGPMIADYLRSGDAQIGRSGMTDVKAALAEADARYEDFARVADRLCVNIATYLMPVTRRFVT